MAGRGRSFTFHGAFKKKADAVRKEKSIAGAYIKRVHLFRGKKGS